MGLFRRNVRRFTAAESFRSFMEGVRELHHYDKEADEPEPDEDLLNQHLEKAAGFFRDCVDTYPDDLLPRYYFGIVLSVQGQNEQARQLRLDLQGQQPPTNDPEVLFLQAAKHFETIAQDVDRGKDGRDLWAYSEYNRAQALAKTAPVPKPQQKSLNVPPTAKARRAADPNDDEMHWDAALRILQKIDPRLVMTKLSFGERMGVWIRFRLGNLGFRNVIDVWLNQNKRNASEVSAGVAAPLTEKRPEERAFEIQVRVLEYAIQLRKAVYGHRKLTLADLPQDQESERKRAKLARHGAHSATGLDGAAATVRDFIARIQEDTIRSEAQSEIVADYWNKLAFVAWERATLDKTQVDPDWLKRARKYIDIARDGRPNWTPAQLNLARITAAEGDKQEALRILEKVLGKKKQDAKQANSSVTAGAPHSDSVAEATSQAVEKNTGTATGTVQRSYRDILQDLRTPIEQSQGNLTQLEYDQLHRRKRAARFARDRRHNRKVQP